MIYECMIMKGYRQFKDATIYFTIPTPYLSMANHNKNITIVFAKNGVGKSDMLNGVEYCSYGIEKHLSEKSKALSIINTEIEKELKPNESYDVSVEIRGYDENDNNKRYIIRRVQTFRKSANGKDAILVPNHNANSGTSRFDVFEQVDKDMQRLLYPDDFISEMAPENISEFFFYDGEKLHEFFKEGSGKNIKEQVFKISQIAVLEQMEEHVNKVMNMFPDESYNISIKMKDIQKKLKSLEDQRASQIKSLNELKGQRDNFEKDENHYNELLGNHKDVKVLVTNRNQLESDLKGIDNNLKLMKNQKLVHVIDNTVHILASTPIIQTHKMIQKKMDADEIPKYNKEFLIDLQQSICLVCPLHGSDSLKEDEHKNYINSLLQGYDNINELSTELITIHSHLDIIIGGMKDFKKKLAPIDESINVLEEEYQRKFNEKEQISGKIKKIGEEKDEKELIFYEDKKLESSRLKRDTEDRIAILNNGIRDLDESINKENKNIDRELAKDGNNKLIVKKRKFCEDAVNAIEKIKNDIMEGVKKGLEEKTNRVFLDFMDMHGKKGEYICVKILDDFSVSVIHKNGKEGMGSLSQGERQMLAYSYMCALNSVSGFYVPIIVDTPMKGLDDDNKQIIASYLPVLLKEKQLTLLLRNDEYTNEVRDKLREYIGKEYTMNFKEGVTNIIPLDTNNQK